METKTTTITTEIVSESDSVSSGEVELTVKNPYSTIEAVKEAFEGRGEVTEGRKGLFIAHDGGHAWWEFSLSHSQEDPTHLVMIVESSNGYLMSVIKDDILEVIEA